MQAEIDIQIPSSLVGTQWPGVGHGVYVRNGNRLLAGKRGGASAFSSGRWCAPGGKLDFGETFEDSAKRETWEESGIVITNVRVMGVTNDIYPDEGRHFVTIALVADYVSGTARVMEPGKMESWEWLTWEEFCQKPVLLSTKNFMELGINPLAVE